MQSRAGVAMCVFAVLASAAELSVTHNFICLLCHIWSAFLYQDTAAGFVKAWQLSVLYASHAVSAQATQ